MCLNLCMFSANNNVWYPQKIGGQVAVIKNNPVTAWVMGPTELPRSIALKFNDIR